MLKIYRPDVYKTTYTRQAQSSTKLDKLLLSGTLDTDKLDKLDKPISILGSSATKLDKPAINYFYILYTPSKSTKLRFLTNALKLSSFPEFIDSLSSLSTTTVIEAFSYKFV